jgi:predicted metal-dependent hydrolase
MTRTVALTGRQIQYILIQGGRNKRIRLTVRAGGEIRVSAPTSMSTQNIERFMIQKSAWILAKHDYLKQFPPTDQSKGRAEYQLYKKQALDLALSRIAYFNKIYGFTHGKVTIKNHSTLWGSCSRRGNLNFNYKIALLPDYARDYIIVHELCHLREFNHSGAFWSLVAQTVPEYKRIRLELRQLGLNLS